ncbi:FMN-binding protein [Streptomyces sp. ME19-01-6]|uniref:FMN-binding protein n=1 Tax=Streptomyces sp. ME19-01-6 TaxID=3028686 RepID=UPI0029BB2797|nr:FMN-binding protein [Streptomyces sp. ME19-01-6]MDX3225267.1 FMN-binding protein [Streptomyces sp. ME19-01-6]
MKRALPVLALTVLGLIPLWRYEPSSGTTAEAAEPAPSPSSSSSSSVSPSASAAGPQVVQGSTVNTEKGAVQVEVVFESDKITAVRMLQAPDHPQTKSSVPKLIEETLEAQSADIDTVSGATITSDGYIQSLQAAIDAKGP